MLPKTWYSFGPASPLHRPLARNLGLFLPSEHARCIYVLAPRPCPSPMPATFDLSPRTYLLHRGPCYLLGQRPRILRFPRLGTPFALRFPCTDPLPATWDFSFLQSTLGVFTSSARGRARRLCLRLTIFPLGLGARIARARGLGRFSLGT